MVWQKNNNLALLMDIYNASIAFWKACGKYSKYWQLLSTAAFIKLAAVFFFFSVDLLLFLLFFFSSVAYRSS